MLGPLTIKLGTLMYFGGEINTQALNATFYVGIMPKIYIAHHACECSKKGNK